MKKILIMSIVSLVTVSAHASSLTCQTEIANFPNSFNDKSQTVTNDGGAGHGAHVLNQIEDVGFRADADGRDILLMIEQGSSQSRVMATSGQKLQMQYLRADGSAAVASITCNKN